MIKQGIYREECLGVNMSLESIRYDMCKTLKYLEVMAKNKLCSEQEVEIAKEYYINLSNDVQRLENAAEIVKTRTLAHLRDRLHKPDILARHEYKDSPITWPFDYADNQESTREDI